MSQRKNEHRPASANGVGSHLFCEGRKSECLRGFQCSQPLVQLLEHWKLRIELGRVALWCEGLNQHVTRRPGPQRPAWQQHFLEIPLLTVVVRTAIVDLDWRT